MHAGNKQPAITDANEGAIGANRLDRVARRHVLAGARNCSAAASAALWPMSGTRRGRIQAARAQNRDWR